jgi:hypothetical protein
MNAQVKSHQKAIAAQAKFFAFLTVFVVFGLLAFSEDLLWRIFGLDDTLSLLAADGSLLVIALALARRTRRLVGSRDARRTAGPAWFVAGAALLVVLDIAWGRWEDEMAIAIPILLAFVPALFMVVCYALDLDPWRALRDAREDDAESIADRADVVSAVPILVGTGAAFVGEYLYFRALETNVDQEYFAQVVQVIPLLLIALGIEARFFSLDAPSRPIRWAMTVYAILILVIAEALALTALAVDPEREALYEWHEWIAVTATLYGCFMALAAVVLVLIVGPGVRGRAQAETGTGL